MFYTFDQNLGYKLADGSWSYEYKIGDKFVATISNTFSEGSVIELIRDDSSFCPLFELVEGSCKYELGRDGAPGYYYAWEELSPYKEEQ